MAQHLFSRFLQLLVSYIILFSTCSVSAQWSVAHLSEKREQAFPLVVGRKVLFIGGEGNNGYSKTVDIYDDSTGMWAVAQLTKPSGLFITPPAVATGHTALILSLEEQESKVVHIYDADNDSWTVNNLSTERSGIAVGSVGDLAFFAGGYNGQTHSTRVDIYNSTTKVWSTAEMSEARSYASVGTLGKKIFIAGGVLTNTGASKTVDIFDTETGIWTTALLGTGRGMMSIVAVGNKLIFAGGGVLDFYLFNAIDIYDGDTDSWSTATLNQSTYFSTLRGVASNGKAFFAGGLNPSNTLDIFDAATNTWELQTTPTAHQLFPLVALNNKVFLAGGLNNPTGQVDVFNTQTNTWSNIGNLSVPRYYVGGAVVGNKALFAGGGNTSAERFDVVDIYTDTTSGIREVLNMAADAVFPNPSFGLFWIKMPDPTAVLQVYDMRGRLVVLKTNTSADIVEIDLSSLAPGVYLLQIKGQEAVYVSKMAKL